MQATATERRDLYTLAGVGGLLVAVLILTFAVVGTAHGLAFAFEIREGGSIRPWIERVHAQPVAWRFVTACLSLGFGAMLVTAFAVYRLLDPGRWQRHLFLCGYLIGVPTVMNTFLSHYALMYQIGRSPSPASDQLALVAEISMQEWILAASRFGPFFIVVLGTGVMAWCALRDRLLPPWLCWWGMACGAAALLQLFSGFWSPLRYFTLGAGPPHMLWFGVAGAALLRRR